VTPQASSSAGRWSNAPGKRYLDWRLDAPAGKGVEHVRPVRDEIERRVRRLLDELGVPATG
jgi:arsenate reductase (thioredoxin)